MSIKAKNNWYAHIIRDNRSQSARIKHAQYEVIDTMGVKKLQNNNVVTLGLKIDEDGILRSHGRFNNADIPEETKVPICLPRKNYWTELLVKEFHQKLFHAG